MADRGGSIVNISSIASVEAPAGASVYSGSKGAVEVITRSLAAELGPQKILVNAVLPGPVDTEGNRAMANAEQINATFLARTPLGRIGRPRDIATVVSLPGVAGGWMDHRTDHPGRRRLAVKAVVGRAILPAADFQSASRPQDRGAAG